MKKIFCICTVFLLGFYANAQQPPVPDRWIMNERLLDLVNSYENYANFNKSSDRYAFVALFKSPGAPVFCDYLSSPVFGGSIGADEYAAFSMGMEDRRVWISNLRKGTYKKRDGHWAVQVEFDKRVDYEDAMGCVFSTQSPMVGGDSHLVMDCEWNEEDQVFKIVSINGRENAASTFPKGNFLVVEKKNEIDERMLYNGKKLAFDDYGFAILPDGGLFEVDDDDFSLSVHRKPGAGRYEMSSFSVVPKRFRARAHISLSPFSAYKVSASSDGVISSESFSGELGGDIGYALSLGKTSKLAFYTGLGLAYSTLSLSAQDIQYQIAVYDSERNPITRNYKLENVTEGVSMTDIVIPAYLSFEQNFSRKLAMVADLGVKVYLSSSATPKTYHIQGTVNGNVIDKDYEQFVVPNQNSLNQYSLSLLGKLGLDYSFSSGMFAFLHFGYEYGLTDSYAPVTPVKWYGTEGIYPLVYTGTEDVAVHSFLSSIAYKRAGVVIELGVRFKFGKKE